MQNKTTFVHKGMKGGRKTLGAGRGRKRAKKSSLFSSFSFSFFLPRYRLNVRREGKKRRGHVGSEEGKKSLLLLTWLKNFAARLSLKGNTNSALTPFLLFCDWKTEEESFFACLVGPNAP